MGKFRYEIVTVVLPAVDTEVDINFKTNAKYKRIVGLYTPVNPTDYGSLVLGEFTGGLKINDREILPIGFPSTLLMSSRRVAPNKRFYPIEIEAEGRSLTGKFTMRVALLFPARLKMVLKYEIE